MKNITKSLVIIIAVAAVASFATYAYFSDTETSTGNSFAAGTLDLQLGQTESLPFSESNIAPGQSGEGKIALTNSGNIPGKLNVSLANLVQSENGITEPEQGLNGEYTPDSGELGMFLNFVSFIDVDRDGNYGTGDYQLSYNGVNQLNYFAGWKAWQGRYVDWNDIMTLNGGQTVDLVMRWELPTESQDGNYSQNIAQSDGLGFDVNFALNQVHP